MTHQITIHDASTGETIVQDMTESEIAAFEFVDGKKAIAQRKAAEKAFADKRQTILDRLGLTADEFQTLIK